MEIKGIVGSGGVYAPAAQKQELHVQDTATARGISAPKTDTVEISGNAEYLTSLQKQFPNMAFTIGTGFAGQTARNTGDAANPWAFTIDPNLLEKMRSSPDAEAAYTQRLRDIARATALADGIRQSRGMKTVYCENYIDENGQLHHTSISVRKDELNEQLREEARKKIEELTARTREKNQEAAEKLEAILTRSGESGELRLDSEDMRWIGIAAKSGVQPEKPAGPDEEAGDSEESVTSRGSVGINAGKLARMLAAAKTQSQVRAVMAKIQADLRECDSGEARGMDVDKASVAAAEQILQQARSRMGQTENREPTPEEQTASAMAALL